MATLSCSFSVPLDKVVAPSFAESAFLVLRSEQRVGLSGS